MGKTSSDPWPASARMVVSLLVVAIGLTLTTSAVGFARATSAIHHVDKVSTQAQVETKCNSDWKAAYRAAQKPRLKAQKANLESQLRFYRNIDRLTSDTVDMSPAAQKARREAAHRAIKAAYDDTAAQLDAQDNNSYPKDECGHGSTTPKKPKTSRPSLPPQKGSDHAKTGSTTLGSSGSGGQRGFGADGTVGVGGGPATGSNGGGGGGGGSTGNPGGGSSHGGGGGTPGTPNPFGDLLAPICSVLRLPGCGS